MDVTWTTEEVIDFLKTEHSELVRTLRDEDQPLTTEEKLALLEVVNSVFTMLVNTLSIKSASKMLDQTLSRLPDRE